MRYYLVIFILLGLLRISIAATAPAATASKPTTTYKLKYIQEALRHATADEKKDLTKLLDQIEVSPIKAKYKGKTVFKVRFVEKNSVFDRAGIKRGDLVLTGHRRLTNKKDQ